MIAVYVISAIIGAILGYAILFFIIKYSVKNGIKEALIEVGIVEQETIKKTAQDSWSTRDSWMEKYYKKKASKAGDKT